MITGFEINVSIMFIKPMGFSRDEIDMSFLTTFFLGALETTKENNLFCFVTGLNSVNWQCKEKKAPFHEFIEFNDNKKTLGQSNV